MDAQTLLRAALAREADAQRLLLADDGGATEAFRQVSDLYRRSWEQAHARAYGRLIGMLKAAVLAGGGEEEAALIRKELGRETGSPTRAYAVALGALVEQDDELAAQAAAAMEDGPEPFTPTAAAIGALAGRDEEAYAETLAAVVADFESRQEHLTGVAFADTAAVLEALAERREMAVRPASELLPQVP